MIESVLGPANDEKARFWQWAIVGLFFLGLFLVAVGLGLWILRGQGQGQDDIQIISADESTGSGEIVVHVDGAVVRPGVYQLKSDTRVVDAVGAAGGLKADADESRVNLAAKVVDGQKIYVARVGESVSLPAGKAGQSIGGSASRQVGGAVSALININNASQAELEELPGVGPVTASKIIASRPYSAPEDLLVKKVVSRSVFEKIKDLISY